MCQCTLPIIIKLRWKYQRSLLLENMCMTICLAQEIKCPNPCWELDPFNYNARCIELWGWAIIFCAIWMQGLIFVCVVCSESVLCIGFGCMVWEKAGFWLTRHLAWSSLYIFFLDVCDSHEMHIHRRAHILGLSSHWTIHIFPVCLFVLVASWFTKQGNSCDLFFKSR